MNHDIPESVSQRSSGEETAENSRIHEISDELRRRCELYETQLRNGKEYVSRLEVEQRVAEQYAKDNGIWLPMNDVFDLGVPGPSGNENDTYVAKSCGMSCLDVLMDNEGDMYVVDAEIAKSK